VRARLSGLKNAFDKAQLQTSEQLQAWLANPQSASNCCRNCASPRSTRSRCNCSTSFLRASLEVADRRQPADSAIGNQVLDAVLSSRSSWNWKSNCRTPVVATSTCGWCCACRKSDDYKAVILSISDITSRKLIELSLLEREGFWSDVVRTVPDHCTCRT
jgi:hypothetical protein